MSRGVLWVPIENIGSGPALSIEVSLDVAAAALVKAVGDEGVSGASRAWVSIIGYQWSFQRTVLTLCLTS